MNINMNIFRFTLPFITCILIIFWYSRFRCINPKFVDPLETPIISIIDGWSLTHLFFFMFIGYTFPYLFVLALIYGIIWEIFEAYSGKYKPNFIHGFGNCRRKSEIISDSDKWWYGKWSDIFMNSLGYLIGQYIKVGKIIIF